MVQKGRYLRFSCTQCRQPVQFSLLELDEHQGEITCVDCKQRYSFNDETLRRQLRKFVALCRQLVDSEEILSQTSVGIDVNGKQVKVPYKLLLTRFNSVLDLDIGGVPLSIEFRLEPLQDCVAESN